MDLKGGENGRTASWLGHICRSGRHERSRHKSSAGSAPRSTHSYFIVREEDATSGYPYGPKVPGGRRRRPDDSQTGGPAKTGADPDRGCGDRLLAPRKEQAQDPPAQQPGRFRCPGRCLLGAALRADLLRPHLGMAIGALMGGMSGALADIGIDDDFVNEVRENVTEGTSALFLLSRGAVVDRVAEEVKGLDFAIIETNLPKEQEEKLREAFAV